MGLIREPLDIDFYVENKTLTEKERQMITQHIKDYKANIAQQKKDKRGVKSRSLVKEKY